MADCALYDGSGKREEQECDVWSGTGRVPLDVVPPEGGLHESDENAELEKAIQKMALGAEQVGNAE